MEDSPGEQYGESRGGECQMLWTEVKKTKIDRGNGETEERDAWLGPVNDPQRVVNSLEINRGSRVRYFIDSPLANKGNKLG